MPESTASNLAASQIVGHEAQQRDLFHALERKRLGHAYLFAGPSGVGKGMVAERLARALVCDDPADDGMPCGICRQCGMVLAGIHPDVQRFRKDKSAFSAESMRENVITWAMRKPREGSCKIGVIDDVEHFSRAAANAFLKTLEEPPSGTLWILLSGDLGVTLTTIVSRCRVVHFHRLNARSLSDLLAGPLSEACDEIVANRPAFPWQEAAESDEDSAVGLTLGERGFVTNAADGSPGLALDLLDAGAMDVRNFLVDVAAAATSVRDPITAAEMLIAAVQRNGEANQFGVRRRLELIIGVLAGWLRDVRALTFGENVTLANRDRLAKLKAWAKQLDVDGSEASIRQLLSLSTFLRRNVNPRIVAANALLEFASNIEHSQKM